MIAPTRCASSCCMLLTCLSTLSASSRVTILHLSFFASATAPRWKNVSVSFAASGFWKPILHFAPALIAGTLYAVGDDARGLLDDRPEAAVAADREHRDRQLLLRRLPRVRRVLHERLVVLETEPAGRRVGADVLVDVFLRDRARVVEEVLVEP